MTDSLTAQERAEVEADLAAALERRHLVNEAPPLPGNELRREIYDAGLVREIERLEGMLK